MTQVPSWRDWLLLEVLGTPLSPHDIVRLLELCLKHTYFAFQDQFYLQIHGAAMGSPVAALTCNLYMEDFEQKALNTFAHKPDWWKRYVDDMHTKLEYIHAQAFTDGLNTIDEDIQWTRTGEVDLPSNPARLESIEERTEKDLVSLDTWPIINNDGSIRSTVF